MKRGAQVAFGLSALFLCSFVFGITHAGQVVSQGRIPQNATQQQLDDIYMGAGLAPWVYGLVPSSFLAFVGSGLACSQSSLLGFSSRLTTLTIAIAVGGWVVGYTYLIRIAGYPAAGFLKIIIGLLAVSFTTCVIFRLRGFFTRPPR
jgi:hypothetical protein